MSFFKRSGTYNLDCFGRVGYINDVKTAKKKKKKKKKKNMETHVLMQASDWIINYFNKISFCCTICDTFLHINK